MPYGVFYMLNGIGVTSPDEERWSPIVLGDAIDGLQRRSPYMRLEWHLRADGKCGLDWFPYDNTVLTSLTCRPDGELAEHETYTDVFCKSVVGRQNRGVMTEIIAVFLVNVSP